MHILMCAVSETEFPPVLQAPPGVVTNYRRKRYNGMVSGVKKQKDFSWVFFLGLYHKTLICKSKYCFIQRATLWLLVVKRSARTPLMTGSNPVQGTIIKSSKLEKDGMTSVELLPFSTSAPDWFIHSRDMCYHVCVISKIVGHCEFGGRLPAYPTQS